MTLKKSIIYYFLFKGNFDGIIIAFRNFNFSCLYIYKFL